MLIVFCWTLELAIAINEDGYNDIVPSILLGEYHSPSQCPEGYSGQYPNCVPPYFSQNLSPISEYLPSTPPNTYIPPSAQCPPGSVGYIPFCTLPDRKYVPPTQDVQHPQQQCPTDTIGYYPDCQQPPTPPPHQCPLGSVGQFPNCEIQPYPTPPPQCPLGTFGYYPNCQTTAPSTPPPLSQCPFGSIGQFPDCRQPDQCPPGSIGYYPNCQLQPPSSITPIPQCPFGSVGQFSDCQQSPQSCPPGMIGYYPYCVSPPLLTTKKPTPTPTKRLPPKCPPGSIGKFPNCKEPKPPRIYIPGQISNPSTEPDSKDPPPLSWCIIGWDEYKTRFNKNYDTHEDTNRRVLFEKNQKLIEAHNALYEQHKETYSLCVNRYSDWSMGEYLSILGIDDTKLPFTPDEPDDPNNIIIGDDEEIGYTYKGPRPKPQGASRVGEGGGRGVGTTGPETVPNEWDWRMFGAVTPIKDQMMCASCWAFSAVGALESHFFIKKRSVEQTPKPFFEQQLIDCTKQLGNNGCRKGFMHKAYEYTKSNGIGAETEYPYAATDGASCRAAFNDLKNINYQNITDQNKVFIKEAVYMMGPVSAAMDARENFKSLGHYGVYFNKMCTIRNNHAVLIVGYGYDNEQGLPFWIIKNSFGEMWGNGGYGRILRDANHCGIASLASFPVV